MVDIDIHAGQDEMTREQLLENLAGHRDKAITPLWLNRLRARADLRMV
jgi:hypothetical protein